MLEVIPKTNVFIHVEIQRIQTFQTRHIKKKKICKKNRHIL